MTEKQPTGNRRASRRRSPKRSTKVFCYRGPLGLGANLGVSVLDLSETGASLVVEAPFKQGEDMEVNLEGIVHRRPIRKMAIVVWCVPAENERWAVGVKFQAALRYADLSDLCRV